ncbi:MAG: polysaccharide biosynthesis/export family protein [Armatimonadota bacterium]|nr:polysaccharide biosynthesis/export family protein [Armatimonadota bacterium]
MKIWMRLSFCTQILVLFFVLQAGRVLSAEMLPPAGYVLDTEDVVEIQVVGDPSLSTKQMVDPEGNISIPLVNEPIKAKGLTLQQLVNVIKERIRPYLTNPDIQVTIAQFHTLKAYVLGQVNRPGLHEFRPGDRVMEIIAQAGSFTEQADLKGATITRKGSTEAQPLNLYDLFYKGDMSQNLEIQAGDVIYIPEDTKNKFFVLGEVLRPGQYRLKEGMTIMDALANAAGPTDRAVLSKTTIIRGDINNPERIEINMSKVLKKADLSQAVELKPGDIVYVPETSKPDWNKVSGIVSAVVNTTYLFRILGF